MPEPLELSEVDRAAGVVGLLYELVGLLNSGVMIHTLVLAITVDMQPQWHRDGSVGETNEEEASFPNLVQ